MITEPTIVINFKAYKEASGKNAIKLANICEKLSIEHNAKIIICVNTVDLKEIASNVSIPVFSQHVDGDKFGGHTGAVLPEVLVQANSTGTLINHSEDRCTKETLKKSITRCKETGLYSIVCVQNPEEAAEVAKLLPDAIAIEPPELIGGDISVTTSNPKIITDSIKAVKEVNKRIPVLCGAGIKDKEDISISIKLGSKGVLIASGIVKAKDQEKTLIDLIKGLN